MLYHEGATRWHPSSRGANGQSPEEHGRAWWGNACWPSSRIRIHGCSCRGNNMKLVVFGGEEGVFGVSLLEIHVLWKAIHFGRGFRIINGCWFVVPVWEWWILDCRESHVRYWQRKLRDFYDVLLLSLNAREVRKTWLGQTPMHLRVRSW